MQSVEIQGLDRFDSLLKDVLNEIPDARRDLHEKIGDLVKREVEMQIQASGISDSGGRVRAWQQSNIGTLGGYAAVRAEKGATGDNSPGAITNYLENGHKVRGPSATVKRIRKGRAQKSYVDGYHFYEKASRQAEQIAIREAQRYADEVAGKLEG